jgi:type IV fimbrial biogenesis protein FimT
MVQHPVIRLTAARRGFTLIEAMVVVAIVALLVVAGYPAFIDLKLRREVSAKVNTLSSAVRLARVEAVRRGRTVTMCPVSDPGAQLPTCGAAGADWALGWAIYVDDGTNLGVIDPGETIIQVQNRLPGTGRITNNAIADMNFQPTGLPMPPIQSTFTIQSKATSGVDDKAYLLIMSAQGRVTISKATP